MNEAIAEIIRIQEERNLAMKQLSENIGIDISFTEEEKEQFIQEAVEKYIENKVVEGIEKWMKLVS
jgi:predicted DNA-binding protein